jgi:hypothetical protein
MSARATTRGASVDTHAIGRTLAEHRRLDAAVAVLDRALAGPTAGEEWRLDVEHRLVGLREALTDHFAGEEARGLFSAIEAAGGSAVGTARRLRADHAHLLAETDRIVAEAGRRGAGRASRRAWVFRARGLLRALADHEARENAVLVGVVEDETPASD